jgi:nitroreductase
MREGIVMLRDLIVANRSYRRFHEDVPIDQGTLRVLVDLARLSASGGNTQKLKYIISCDPERNAKIFPHLSWAGHLPEWPGPAEGERPTAYVIIVLDTDIGKKAGCDQGIAAQSILLGATEIGFGGCMIGSIQREGLRNALSIPEQYKIELVIALGKTKETVIIDTVKNGNIKYWRDDKDQHHVPKRSLDEIILEPNQSIEPTRHDARI